MDTPPAVLAPTVIYADESEWLDHGRTLFVRAQRTMWEIGEWWRDGQALGYGQRYAAIRKEGIISPETAQDAAWVCGRIETSRRREVLSFSHHKEVAAYPPETQDELLDKAVSHNWTRQQLRAAAKGVKGTHVAQNSGNNEWYTPRELIQAATDVMGAIDLDPASSAAAQKVVCATTYFDEAKNGLAQEWHGRVWMNPPYSALLIGRFIEKLCTEHALNHVPEAIVLVNNGTETAWGQMLLTASSRVCFPKGRVRFLEPGGSPVGAPLQGQMIAYLGSRPEVFADKFTAFGVCVG